MRTKPKPEKYGSFHPGDLEAWHEWLNKNHASSQGVWLTVRKKNSSQKGILLPDAVEEGLCFGWIDSKLKPQNQDFYRLLFTPRKPGSIWSETNKKRVEQLAQEGKMTAAGLAKVAAAKKDGSWDKMTAVDQLEIPQDFHVALAINVAAQKNFELLNASLKKQVLWWLESAKTDETRAKRIKLAVEKLQNGKRNPLL